METRFRQLTTPEEVVEEVSRLNKACNDSATCTDICSECCIAKQRRDCYILYYNFMNPNQGR